MSQNPRALGRDPAQAGGLVVADAARRVSALERRPSTAKGADYEAGTVSTTNNVSFVDLGGPEVQLRIPDAAGASGVAFVSITLDLEILGSGASETALLAIQEPVDYPTAALLHQFTVNAAWNRYVSAPPVLIRATPGVRTFKLYYRAWSVGGMSFRNRRMGITA
jgi:hypothetical protein